MPRASGAAKDCAPRCSTCTRGSACGRRGSCCSHSPARCRPARSARCRSRASRIRGSRSAFAELLGGPPPATAGGAWQRAPDLDALLRRDAARMPDFRPEAVVLHGWGDANARVEIAGTTAGLPSTAVFERHLFRAADGLWLADATSRGRGFWLRTFIAVQPLHFAQYGWVGAMGGVLRVVHFLMGPPRALCATGCIRIERRRAQQDRSANVLAAVAVGTCGGRARGRRTAVRRACVARWRARRSSARDAVLGRVGRRGRAGGLWPIARPAARADARGRRRVRAGRRDALRDCAAWRGRTRVLADRRGTRRIRRVAAACRTSSAPGCAAAARMRPAPNL